MNTGVNRKSVRFAGEPLNLSAISRDTGISLAHLSRIFSGEREPSVLILRRLLDALSMTAEEFFRARCIKLAEDQEIAQRHSHCAQDFRASRTMAGRTRIPLERSA